MIKKEDIKVDYDRSIVSISSSILRHYDINNEYKSLPILDELLAQDYQNVVLMIIDGMGSEIIKRNLPEDSFLCRHKIADISSVFPPTTAAATTAYHSGLPPYASGWLGWMEYFPQYSKTIELFNNIDYYSGEPSGVPAPSKTLIKYQTIYEKVVEAHPEIEFHKIFPDFEKNGVKSFAEFCARIKTETLSNTNRKIFATYWTEPDRTIHQQGIDAPDVKEVLIDINARLEDLERDLDDTLIIISADHGAIDVKEIWLNEYSDICDLFERPPALECRFKTFYIKPGREKEFETLFADYFGQDFVLYRKQEFLQSGIIGNGRIHPVVEQSLGDFITIGVTDKELRYTLGERKVDHMMADHAGFSPSEMTIPLIIIKKKK